MPDNGDPNNCERSKTGETARKKDPCPFWVKASRRGPDINQLVHRLAFPGETVPCYVYKPDHAIDSAAMDSGPPLRGDADGTKGQYAVSRAVSGKEALVEPGTKAGNPGVATIKKRGAAKRETPQRARQAEGGQGKGLEPQCVQDAPKKVRSRTQRNGSGCRSWSRCDQAPAPWSD